MNLKIFLETLRIFATILTIGFISSLLVLPLMGCAATKNSNTFGNAQIEQCALIIERPDNTIEKTNCEYIKTEGISAEFAGITKALFAWWPF